MEGGQVRVKCAWKLRLVPSLSVLRHTSDRSRQLEHAKGEETRGC